MSARSFLDTNVLVYADDGDSPEKQQRAIEVTLEHRAAGTGVLSLQVLQEYFAITTRKLGTDSAVARRKVEVLSQFDAGRVFDGVEVVNPFRGLTEPRVR